MTVDAGMLDFDKLELDASLSCPSRRDATCAHWDHVVQLFVCCDHFSPYCNMELGRWVTAFRRYGNGHYNKTGRAVVCTKHKSPSRICM